MMMSSRKWRCYHQESGHQESGRHQQSGLVAIFVFFERSYVVSHSCEKSWPGLN